MQNKIYKPLLKKYLTTIIRLLNSFTDLVFKRASPVHVITIFRSTQQS